MGRKCVDYGEECSGGRREEKEKGKERERKELASPPVQPTTFAGKGL